MPKKPRHAKPMPLSIASPSSNDPHLPVLSALISSALKRNNVVSSRPISQAIAHVSPLKSNPPVKMTSSHRKRRKREPIQIPPESEHAQLSAAELRSLKNRIATMRLRQRSQQNLQLLQEQRDYYQARCQLLETVVSSCRTCQNLAAMEFIDIELLSVDLEDFSIKKQTELNDPTMLTEAECVGLDHVLQS